DLVLPRVHAVVERNRLRGCLRGPLCARATAPGDSQQREEGEPGTSVDTGHEMRSTFLRPRKRSTPIERRAAVAAIEGTPTGAVGKIPTGGAGGGARVAREGVVGWADSGLVVTGPGGVRPSYSGPGPPGSRRARGPRPPLRC